MAQNIYDQPEFFSAYGQLNRSIHGLQGVPEWPDIRALLPDLAEELERPHATHRIRAALKACASIRSISARVGSRHWLCRLRGCSRRILHAQ